MTGIAYCTCETPIMDPQHDAGCRRCGLPVDFSPAPPASPGETAEAGMPARRFAVEVSIGALTIEVDAEDEDAAISAAISEWADQAHELICAGTFGVRELEAG